MTADMLVLSVTFDEDQVSVEGIYHNTQAATQYLVRPKSYYIRLYGFYKVAICVQVFPDSEDADFEPLFDTSNMELKSHNRFTDIPDILMNTRALELDISFIQSYVSVMNLSYANFSWFTMDTARKVYRSDGHIYPSHQWFSYMFSQGPSVFPPYDPRWT